MSDGRTAYVLNADVSVAYSNQTAQHYYAGSGSFVVSTYSGPELRYTDSVIEKILKAKRSPAISAPSDQDEFMTWLRNL